MYQINKIKDCFSGLIGVKNHYDTNAIPELPAELQESKSGLYLQDLHPAMRLDLIEACLPPNRQLEDYLQDKLDNGIQLLMNEVVAQRKLYEYGKELLSNQALLYGYGWAKNVIVNESRFVGFRITIADEIGLKVSLKGLGFQFNEPQTDLEIYVYHSSRSEKVTSFNFTSTKGLDWAWIEDELEMFAQTNEIQGGSYVIGYYQDDIQGQAINFTDFNWQTGPCGTCDGGHKRRLWNDFNKYASVMPIYVPAGAQDVSRNMFDMDDTIVDLNKSYGMNIKLSAECDLSYFLCENKTPLINGYGLMVVYSILKDIQFSEQINHIEESLKMMIIRDLEGDKETNYINIADQLKVAIKNINFDFSKISKPCLSCNHNKGVSYGVA